VSRSASITPMPAKAAMHTENRIDIRGDVRRVFHLAAQVEKWPQILPHYRWVRVLQRKKRRSIVEMAARRGRIPVSWTAVQEVFPYERITYKHIKGFTTGMEVAWTFSVDQGQVRVVITHDFTLNWPLIGGVVSKYIVGGLFVRAIASKTLQHIKNTVEAGHVAGNGPQRARR
jgi:ribosome-associated toxin RatA of RatAB toxin-antitoxin module